jgi:hypothetical protein
MVPCGALLRQTMFIGKMLPRQHFGLISWRIAAIHVLWILVLHIGLRMIMTIQDFFYGHIVVVQVGFILLLTAHQDAEKVVKRVKIFFLIVAIRLSSLQALQNEYHIMGMWGLIHGRVDNVSYYTHTTRIRSRAQQYFFVLKIHENLCISTFLCREHHGAIIYHENFWKKLEDFFEIFSILTKFFWKNNSGIMFSG